MINLELELKNDEYYDFLDLLENAYLCEYPSINHEIAELILKKIEESD